MFKALNDLLTPDFPELLHGLRSNGPQKLCVLNINSDSLVKVVFDTLVQ